MKTSDTDKSSSSPTDNQKTTSLKLWIVLAGIFTVNCSIYLNKFESRLSQSVDEGTWHVKTTASVSDTDTKMDAAADSLRTRSKYSTSTVVATDDSSEKKDRSNGNSAKKKKYNVMIFYPDDWRHDTLGVAGTQPVKTPFLDQLSREGIRFTHNCVTTSICWISRATMFTGQYYSRHKSRYIRQPVFYESWNETYIYTMQKNGYFVGHIGKWQFRDAGFVSEHYNWTSLYEGVHWHKVNGEQVHSTVRDERNAIKFLRERPKDVPFVLTTAFYAPKAVGEGAEQHSPMDKTEHLYDGVEIPPPIDPEWAFQQLPQFMQDNYYYLEGRRRYKQRFDFNVSGLYDRFQRKYYRMVSEVDEAVKNVVDELKAQGELDNTILIFTTGTFSLARHLQKTQFLSHCQSQ